MPGFLKVEFNINEILSLFIIIIFYLNLSALQMKESLESLRDHNNYNCQLEIRHELGIFPHGECLYRLD